MLGRLARPPRRIAFMFLQAGGWIRPFIGCLAAARLSSPTGGTTLAQVLQAGFEPARYVRCEAHPTVLRTACLSVRPGGRLAAPRRPPDGYFICPAEEATRAQRYLNGIALQGPSPWVRVVVDGHPHQAPSRLVPVVRFSCAVLHVAAGAESAGVGLWSSGGGACHAVATTWTGALPSRRRLDRIPSAC